MIDSALTIEQLGINKSWALIDSADDDRLYMDKNNGRFLALTFVCSDANGANVQYEVMFDIEFRFDGARHLWLGSKTTDNYGYLYCPDLDVLAQFLKKAEAVAIDKNIVRVEQGAQQ